MKSSARRSIIRFLCMVMAVSMLIGVFNTPVEAAVPKINAKITSARVLSLLKAYDPDGRFLVTRGQASGSDFMEWFAGSSRIVDGIDTAVHEQCHACTYRSFDSEFIYRGNEKFYTVEYTDIYYSKEMASSIPKKFRTFRYDTYVAKPSQYLASNIDGVYGLLNEFTAYCWGMNNTVSLYEYYKKSGTNLDTWSAFISDGASDRLAYSEFNYYILHYLYYAKQHYPRIYKQIMNNSSFKKAYRFIEKKFRKNIASYENKLKALIKLLNKEGHNAVISGDFLYCDNQGVGIIQKDYDMLCKEIQKSKYQSIYKKLIA